MEVNNFICEFCGTLLNNENRFNSIIKCPGCDREKFLETENSIEYKIDLNKATSARQKADFDEAYEKYQKLKKNYPNNIEVLWGLFLTEYGVNFVEESEKNFIPTINRFVETPVIDSKSYKDLMKLIIKSPHKPQYEKEISYIEEARQKIQKYINNNEKFDIFISYKHTINTDKGLFDTPESKYAHSIYKELRSRGYEKIFFSQETLKGKPGTDFEALIYTALKTSKIMLLMSGSLDYINSPWVKNEWSRFESLTQIDSLKTIIPIQIDGFNLDLLPTKIRRFQALSMQDLKFNDNLMSFINQKIPLRLKSEIARKKIDIITDRETRSRETVKVVKRNFKGKLVTNYTVSPSIENEINITKNIYLNSGKFQKAALRFEKIIEKEPMASEAIWCLILTKLTTTSMDFLKPKQDLSISFNYFEKLIQSEPNKIDSYLIYFENHFANSLKKHLHFDSMLFDFILSWKLTEKKQKDFTNKAYELYYSALVESLNIKFDRRNVLKNVYDLTKILNNKDNDIYLLRYTEVAKVLISKNHFEIGKDLLKKVFEVDAMFPEAVKLKILLHYKITSYDKIPDVVRDSSFEPLLDEVLKTSGDNIALFEEIFTAITKTLNSKKYKKNAIEMFDIFLTYIPESSDRYLYEKITEFIEFLIQLKQFEKATRYIEYILSEDPKNKNAYWFKLKVRLKASTNFDVLIKSTKELMYYDEFQNLVHSSEDNEDYLDFYNIDASLREKTKLMKSYNKVFKIHYDEFNSRCSNETLRQFNKDIYPKMIDDIGRIKTKEKNNYKGLKYLSLFNFSMLFSLEFIKIKRLLNNELEVAGSLFESLSNSSSAVHIFASYAFLFSIISVFIDSKGQPSLKRILSSTLLGSVYSIGMLFTFNLIWILLINENYLFHFNEIEIFIRYSPVFLFSIYCFSLPVTIFLIWKKKTKYRFMNMNFLEKLNKNQKNFSGLKYLAFFNFSLLFVFLFNKTVNSFFNFLIILDSWSVEYSYFLLWYAFLSFIVYVFIKAKSTNLLKRTIVSIFFGALYSFIMLFIAILPNLIFDFIGYVSLEEMSFLLGIAVFIFSFYHLVKGLNRSKYLYQQLFLIIIAVTIFIPLLGFTMSLFIEDTRKYQYSTMFFIFSLLTLIPTLSLLLIWHKKTKNYLLFIAFLCLTILTWLFSIA